MDNSSVSEHRKGSFYDGILMRTIRYFVDNLIVSEHRKGSFYDEVLIRTIIYFCG